jgi:hypothetical protein
LTNLFGQDFESRAKTIAAKIETITKEEKAALKTEVELINGQLESGAITAAQAESQKQQVADKRAKNIETRVASAEDELKALVQEKVDGKISENDSVHKKNKISIGWDNKEDRKKKEENGEPRTTSQFVLAGGFNNLVTDGAVANSDFGYLRSVFLNGDSRTTPESSKKATCFISNTGFPLPTICLPLQTTARL